MEGNGAYDFSQLKKDIDDLKKESRAQTIESKIQTAAVLLFFFFGIASLTDFFKKNE
jgi:hypothetical protein